MRVDPREPSRQTPEIHQRGEGKVASIPTGGAVGKGGVLRKPPWIRVRPPQGKGVSRMRLQLRQSGLSSVCEEAACPNIGECFSGGTAAFMILGDLCTRRCPFCDVAHGRPQPPDPDEPARLAEQIGVMGLRHVVVTSVDRDDLRDGGAAHFADSVRAIRRVAPHCRVELLTPDFRGRQALALRLLAEAPPAVFNHNLETVPRRYSEVRPGASYQASLELLQGFSRAAPDVPTKSGLMLGLGERLEEVREVMIDLRGVGCSMLTLGQYLQPTPHHLPVERFVTPAEFDDLAAMGRELGFASVASGPLVRSSYHADRQAGELLSGA